MCTTGIVCSIDWTDNSYYKLVLLVNKEAISQLLPKVPIRMILESVYSQSFMILVELDMSLNCCNQAMCNT